MLETCTSEISFSGGNPQWASDYMHARYYSPHLARFLSVDPGGTFDPSAPQTWNRYAYVANNPLKYVDPTGLELEAFYLVTGTPLDPTLHSAVYFRDTDPAVGLDAVFSLGGMAQGVWTLEGYLSKYDPKENPTTAFGLNLSEEGAARLKALYEKDFQKKPGGVYVYNGPQYRELVNNCAQYAC